MKHWRKAKLRGDFDDGHDSRTYLESVLCLFILCVAKKGSNIFGQEEKGGLKELFDYIPEIPISGARYYQLSIKHV